MTAITFPTAAEESYDRCSYSPPCAYSTAAEPYELRTFSPPANGNFYNQESYILIERYES